MSLHDLPPRWDGHDVTWEDKWVQERATSLDFHSPDLGACAECGSVRLKLQKRGTYWALGVRLAASPLPGPHRRRARQLYAERCADCRHTTVTELGRAGQSWDIDDSDLTDDGSYDQATKQHSLF